MKKTAVISECERYRYQLTRIWDESKPKVMFLMLNPSTADAEKEDPTIKRCMNFAKSWGYGGLMVGNLFAYRSTNPKYLLDVDDPIGPENKKYLDEMIKSCEIVICAWGNGSILRRLRKKEYEKIVLQAKNFHYLEWSKRYDVPKHPLYLQHNLKPIKVFKPGGAQYISY